MSEQDVIGYDVIGDLHGHREPLVRLLGELGYELRHGAYAHPERRAIFVGDLIDRGPDQVGVIDVVRAMLDDGHAQIVLGNHEFNAVAFATEDPERPGTYLRTHNEKHYEQHEVFLAEVGFQTPEHRELIDWFRTIPLWAEVSLGNERLRVVHACWHEASITTLEAVLPPDRTLTHDAVVAASRQGSAVYHAIENVLKGPEVPMGGPVYRDKDGHERREARARWWDTSARTLRALAVIPDGVTRPDNTPFAPLPETAIDSGPFVYTGEVPVVVGHYWENGTPRVYSPKAASVDYSVAKGGHLVAYRWNGERELRNDHFHAVTAT